MASCLMLHFKPNWTDFNTIERDHDGDHLILWMVVVDDHGDDGDNDCGDDYNCGYYGDNGDDMNDDDYDYDSDDIEACNNKLL